MVARAKTVQEYVDSAPPASRANLKALRALLRKTAPRATEAIKWGSPVLEQERILFAYKAHKAHINFMPTGSALRPFASELAGYKTGKDTIQLPHAVPIPKALIRRIAALRVKQVLEEGALWMGRGK
ncbi:MAG TPA: DUF1801 domain-containing protein [Steroidobacteraceae bacterium]|nr:DUF1801 domain-containing protein [Steroidobacteraceae bacterium]